MAKTVGLSRNIKMQWLNKAVAFPFNFAPLFNYSSAADFAG
jgi:hypothetical protein